MKVVKICKIVAICSLSRIGGLWHWFKALKKQATYTDQHRTPTPGYPLCLGIVWLDLQAGLAIGQCQFLSRFQSVLCMAITKSRSCNSKFKLFFSFIPALALQHYQQWCNRYQWQCNRLQLRLPMLQLEMRLRSIRQEQRFQRLRLCRLNLFGHLLRCSHDAAWCRRRNFPRKKRRHVVE